MKAPEQTVAEASLPWKRNTGKAPGEQTAAEASLPWKRSTGNEAVSSAKSRSIQDDNDVQKGEEPSWIKAGEYDAVPDPVPPHGSDFSPSISSSHGVEGINNKEVQNDVPLSSPDSLPWRRDTSPDKSPEQEPTTNLPWREDKHSDDEPAPEEVSANSFPWRRDQEKTVEPETEVPTSVATTNLPWRQAPPEDEVPVPSHAVKVEAELPSSHSFRLSEAESRHSEHVLHMPPMIDPEAEPRETPVSGDLPVDDDAESVDSAQRVAQWLEESDGTGPDPDLDDDFVIDLELKSPGHKEPDVNDDNVNTSTC